MCSPILSAHYRIARAVQATSLLLEYMRAKSYGREYRRTKQLCAKSNEFFKNVMGHSPKDLRVDKFYRMIGSSDFYFKFKRNPVGPDELWIGVPLV